MHNHLVVMRLDQKRYVPISALLVLVEPVCENPLCPRHQILLLQWSVCLILHSLLDCLQRVGGVFCAVQHFAPRILYRKGRQEQSTAVIERARFLSDGSRNSFANGSKSIVDPVAILIRFAVPFRIIFAAVHLRGSSCWYIIILMFTRCHLDYAASFLTKIFIAPSPLRA